MLELLIFCYFYFWTPFQSLRLPGGRDHQCSNQYPFSGPSSPCTKPVLFGGSNVPRLKKKITSLYMFGFLYKKRWPSCCESSWRCSGEISKGRWRAGRHSPAFPPGTGLRWLQLGLWGNLGYRSQGWNVRAQKRKVPRTRVISRMSSRACLPLDFIFMWNTDEHLSFGSHCYLCCSLSLAVGCHSQLIPDL